MNAEAPLGPESPTPPSGTPASNDGDKLSSTEGVQFSPSTQTTRFQLPPPALMSDDSGIAPEEFSVETNELIVQLERHSALVVYGPAFAAEYLTRTLAVWSDGRPIIRAVEESSPLFRKKADALLEALQGQELRGQVLRLDIPLTTGELFACDLWSSGAFNLIVQTLREQDAVLAVSLAQWKHQLPRSLSALEKSPVGVPAPWLPILLGQWNRALSLSTKDIAELEQKISARVKLEPTREAHIAARLRGFRYPSDMGEHGHARLSEFVGDALLRESDEHALVQLVERSWRRDFRRTALGLFALFAPSQYGASYGVLRRLGATLWREAQIRAPIVTEEVTEFDRAEVETSRRETHQFEMRDAVREWLERLDETLRECGLLAHSDASMTLFCTGTHGWNTRSLCDQIWSRYPGIPCRIVEEVLDRNLIFPHENEGVDTAMMVAKLLLAASECAPQAFPLQHTLDTLLAKAAAMARERAAEDENYRWDWTGLGLACFFSQLLLSNRDVGDRSAESSLSALVESSLETRRYSQIKLLLWAFGWLTRDGELRAEPYLLKILDGRGVFSAAHAQEIWDLVFKALRHVTRRAWKERLRTLRNLATWEEDAEPLVAVSRAVLSAHLWHLALRVDFAELRSESAETFADALGGLAPVELEELIRLLWDSPQWMAGIDIGTYRDVGEDSAAVLLHGMAWGSLGIQSLSREALEGELAEIIHRFDEQRVEQARARAQREILTVAEKEIERLQNKGASLRERELAVQKLKESRENLEFASEIFRPFERYRALVLIAWLRTIEDPTRLLASVKQAIDAEQMRSLEAVWDDAYQWVMQFEGTVISKGNVTDDVHREYERVRDGIRHVHLHIRKMIVALRGLRTTRDPIRSI